MHWFDLHQILSLCVYSPLCIQLIFHNINIISNTHYTLNLALINSIYYILSDSYFHLALKQMTTYFPAISPFFIDGNFFNYHFTIEFQRDQRLVHVENYTPMIKTISFCLQFFCDKRNTWMRHIIYAIFIKNP